MQKKIRVLQLIDSLNTGGAEVLAVNIANAVATIDGYCSYLCASRQEGDLKENIKPSVEYFFLQRKKTLDIKAILNLKKFIKKNKISIIHAHSTSIVLAFLVKLLLFNIKIIWHNHYGNSQHLNKKKVIVLKVISQFTDSIISVNSTLKNWAIEKLYCKNVYHIDNFPVFINEQQITFLKGNNGKRIVHLAAFREEKNHSYLLKSFHLLLKDKKYKDWSLHLVGAKNNTNYTQKILNLIKTLQLTNAVFNYGSCLDINHILNQSSIGVLSSKFEGLPVSLLEYGLAKLPVVVTDVGECAKVVEDNVKGVVVQQESSVEFSSKLKELIDSKEKRKKFGLALHQKVTKEYSEESFINKLLIIYK